MGNNMAAEMDNPFIDGDNAIDGEFLQWDFNRRLVSILPLTAVTAPTLEQQTLACLSSDELCEEYMTKNFERSTAVENQGFSAVMRRPSVLENSDDSPIF